MVRERALNHGIQISIDLDRVPVTLRADQDKITQVLYNLLSNAAKFTPDGGAVTVSAKTVERNCRRVRLNGDAQNWRIIQNPADAETCGKIEQRQCVEFRVTDSGIGIKHSDRDRIFKRFEQADGSSRKRFQGTGLGLSLSKRYVELHGGRIWAESDGEDRGSIFKFVLPS
jgi:signal transduction histidine kinase